MTGGFRAEARQVARRLRLPAHARCSQCGQGTELIYRRRPLLCADCHASARGRSVIEAQHPLGIANDPATVPLRASTHRYFTARQHGWNQDTLKNPRGCRRLRDAAALLALADINAFLVDRIALPKARELERRHAGGCGHA